MNKIMSSIVINGSIKEFETADSSQNEIVFAAQEHPCLDRDYPAGSVVVDSSTAAEPKSLNSMRTFEVPKSIHDVEEVYAEKRRNLDSIISDINVNEALTEFKNENCSQLIHTPEKQVMYMFKAEYQLIIDFIDCYAEEQNLNLACDILGIPYQKGLALLSGNAYVKKQLGLRKVKSEVAITDLAPREWRFLTEYFKDFNIEAAAVRANLPSVATARYIMKKPAVKLEMARRQDELTNTTGITAAKVLNEYAKIAFANIGDTVEVINGQVSLKDGADLSGLAEISNTNAGLKIKPYSKMAALEQLGKHLGIIRDKVEVTGSNGGPIQMSSPVDILKEKLSSLIERAKTDIPDAMRNDRLGNDVPGTVTIIPNVVDSE